MRITSKGQVTIPSELRKRAGLLPNTKVEFAYREGVVIVRPAGAKPRIERLAEHLRSAFAGGGKSTAEIMAETRGDHDR